MVVVNGVMLILVVGNIAQVAIGGVLFRILGEFSNFGDAVYHSAVNFTTLGYGDIVMSDKHKLLDLLEAINGVLLIGVSTAALMVFFQDAIRQTIQARQRQSGHNLNKVG
jgi:voltage-gated potassium channel Kch